MDILLTINKIDEDSLDSIYESIQNFIEREIEEIEEEEDSLDIVSENIDTNSKPLSDEEE